MSPAAERIKSEIDLLCAAGGQPGNWQQESYKNSIFQSFLANRSANYDDLRAEVAEAWEAEGQIDLEERERILRQICAAWKEWGYALKKKGL